MISLKQRNKGFTIVELLIVIVVIGILALLVVTTYGGIQQKARNSKRQTDVQALQTQVEAFYSQNGYYPSRADINSVSWRNTNMKSLDKGALVDPSSSCDPEPTSGTPACIVQNATAKTYSYNPLDSSNASCETTDTNCANYTMTATYEGSVNGATKYEKKNLN